MKYKVPGVRVRVGNTVPLGAGKTGVIVAPCQVPQDHRGAPVIEGEYHTISELRRAGWAFIRLDDGSLNVYPRNRLVIV